MSKVSSVRQSLMMFMAAGALVVSAVTWSQRPEAIAVPPLPKADDLSAAFRTVAAEATRRTQGVNPLQVSIWIRFDVPDLFPDSFPLHGPCFTGTRTAIKIYNHPSPEHQASRSGGSPPPRPFQQPGIDSRT